MRNCNKCKNKGWLDDDLDRPGAKSIWQYCSCRHGKLLKRKHENLTGARICSRCDGSGKIIISDNKVRRILVDPLTDIIYNNNSRSIKPFICILTILGVILYVLYR